MNEWVGIRRQRVNRPLTIRDLMLDGAGLFVRFPFGVITTIRRVPRHNF